MQRGSNLVEREVEMCEDFETDAACCYSRHRPLRSKESGQPHLTCLVELPHVQNCEPDGLLQSAMCW